MVGRYLCNKVQDVDFGKAAADNLGDILARLRQVVREWFFSMAMIIFVLTASLYR